VERRNGCCKQAWLLKKSIFVKTGNLGRAKQLLYAAYEERANGFLNLNVDPAVDNLRGTPEFRDLLVKLNLKHP
jgi:hypothetical protein